MAFYVRLAKRKNAPILVPTNTAFEDDTARNRVISWCTVIVFAISVLLSLTAFSVRYVESNIDRWNSVEPLESSFLGNRLRAHEVGCMKQPCFAVSAEV